MDVTALLSCRAYTPGLNPWQLCTLHPETMMDLDTRRLVARMRTLESLALIPRVASTNLVARRIVTECIENELSLPQAMIVAGEQFAGMGRNGRQWSSPAGKGIYATALLTRP